jgi:hypothetical protein
MNIMGGLNKPEILLISVVCVRIQKQLDLLYSIGNASFALGHFRDIVSGVHTYYKIIFIKSGKS